jgi:hypothetical protein
MATLPAICDDCGAIWGAENFIGGSGAVAELTLIGSKIGPCPACGTGMGSIPDGVYDMNDEVISVVEASGASTANLRALVDVFQSRRREEVTDAEVLAAVEAQAPALAATVEAALGKRDPLKWIGILLAILSLYLQVQAPQPPTAQEVARELRADAAPARSSRPTKPRSTDPIRP